MLFSTITSKGQTTIPNEIRKLLHLKSGDKIGFAIDSNGGVRIRAKNRPVSALKGMIKSSFDKPLSKQDIKDAVASGIKEKFSIEKL